MGMLGFSIAYSKCQTTATGSSGLHIIFLGVHIMNWVAEIFGTKMGDAGQSSSWPGRGVGGTCVFFQNLFIHSSIQAFQLLQIIPVLFSATCL